MGIFSLYELWSLFILLIVPNLIIILFFGIINRIKSKFGNSHDNSNFKYNKIGWIVFELSSILSLAFTPLLIYRFTQNLEQDTILFFKISYLLIGACLLYLYIAPTKDTYQENYLNDGDYSSYDFAKTLRRVTLVLYPVLYLIFYFFPLEFLYPLVTLVTYPVDRLVKWLSGYTVSAIVISILSWGILLAVISGTFSSLRKRLRASQSDKLRGDSLEEHREPNASMENAIDKLIKEKIEIHKTVYPDRPITEEIIEKYKNDVLSAADFVRQKKHREK